MGRKVIGGWKKAAIYDPATGDTVQLNTLSTDQSSYEPDNLKSETPTGQAFGGRNIPLAIGFIDSDGISQFEAWSGKRLNAAVFNPGGQHILFEETEQFFFTPGGGVNARDGAAVHALSTEAHGEYPAVHQLKNLAEAINFAGDAGTLLFPLQGPVLTLAADYANNNGATLSIEAQDFAGNILAGSSQSASNGRVSTLITLPANTYKLAIDLVGAGAGEVTNVSLRSDHETAYITY